ACCPMKLKSLAALSFASLSLLFTDNSQATSVGHIDPVSHKFIVETKLFFHGQAVNENIAQKSVEEISRLWNAPKMVLAHHHQDYPIEFHFAFAVSTDNESGWLNHLANIVSMPKELPTDIPAELHIRKFSPIHFSKLYPIQVDGYVWQSALNADT